MLTLLKVSPMQVKKPLLGVYIPIVSQGEWRWGNGKEMKRTNGAKTITRSLRSPLRAIKVSGQGENRFHCKNAQLMAEKNSLTFCKYLE